MVRLDLERGREGVYGLKLIPYLTFFKWVRYAQPIPDTGQLHQPPNLFSNIFFMLILVGWPIIVNYHGSLGKKNDARTFISLPHKTTLTKPL